MTELAFDKTYYSVAELASAARPHFRDIPHRRESFTGVATPEGAYKLATEGWDSGIDETLKLAEDAVATVERQNDVPVWNPVWDVCGGSVDVGAYVTGEPECMIEVPPVRVAKVGKVITLCYSVSVSGSVDQRHIIAKGRVIIALAFALERLGYGLEIIADETTLSRSGKIGRFRTIVKGVYDELDAERVMYAVAHPSFLRVLGFAAAHADIPKPLQEDFGTGNGYGSPHDPIQDLPDGTLYTPSSYTPNDRDIADDVTRYLKELDIIH